jgi:hypothetical protein
VATDLDQLRDQLKNPGTISENAFTIAQQLAHLVNSRGEDPAVHELVIRAREWRDAFGDSAAIVDALLRDRGLFPYLQAERLGFADSLAYEIHRPSDMGDGTVFHRIQARVYRLLLSGKSVILSAPTSFGKSLIIDAIIAAQDFRNVVVVVPTIALIDETRRRLFQRFGDRHRLITRASQRRGDRNIFVLTQERVVEFASMPRVDFFAVDEFYKLDPHQDEDRSTTLNEALYRLLKTGGQFFLLGPNIQTVPKRFVSRFECVFFRSDYATVASETHLHRTRREYRIETLLRLFRDEIRGPTLVYCSSPESARTVAAALLRGGVGVQRPELAQAADWAGEHYHREWGFVSALRNGIGIHHGKIPRALTQFIVRAFDSGDIDVLVCTSTLIEGVNTKAQNVVIYDNRIAERGLDFFSYSNIRGRSGRMLKHFVGHVYLLSDPPQEASTSVDIPLVDQELASDALLLQMSDTDLSAEARDRLRPLFEQVTLPIENLRENRGIDPWTQIALAERIQETPGHYWVGLSWTEFPTSDQLRTVCTLIWEEFVRTDRRLHGVSSSAQLAFKLDRLRAVADIRALIEVQLAEQLENRDPDAAVEDALDFVSYWASYHFPRYLMALDRIQRITFARIGLPSGDYRAFATTVENLFVPPGIAALDEYGVPVQIGMKLIVPLRAAGDLDTALGQLRRLNVNRQPLSGFERTLVGEAQSAI